MVSFLNINLPFAEQKVTDFIPHRAPMVLIDKIISYQHEALVTEVTITPQSPYFDANHHAVPNYVGIEYMAQSIAALAGVEAKLRNDKIRVGFLLGSRKLALHAKRYELGRTYRTHVKRLYQEDSGLAVFDCQIYLLPEAGSEQDKTLVATANVNVFQPQDTQSYLEGTQDVGNNSLG
ncbi:hotdog family protein [Shewanella morhuae]|uniref:(3R)-hydroxymyristoyl-ACP dehydratase n=1 Tax=Shewanella morhuae TaxID=365591 RepID=A0A380AQJ0_9GAMM|nr:hotdog family protein [Shewanella morhuae]SUI85247.1 (3R)-hydroxymyristoyl-ACP dehydratase [Shewanella morhuae]